MQTQSIERRATAVENNPMVASILRQWCNPEVILAVTDLRDEQSLPYHMIQQARRSRAKVLLVHVDRVRSKPGANAHQPNRAHSMCSIDMAREIVDRMVRQLVWSGIACEPILVRGLMADEIPSIARSCCADRVLVSAPIEAQDDARDGESLPEEIMEGIGIPICIVGRSLPLVPRYLRPTRRITLALSLQGNNEIPIAFASRFAQENYSHLSLMHVFPETEDNVLGIDQTKASFVSQLPSAILREAELFCPVEIVVRKGDTASEILKHDSSFNQDYLFLAPHCTSAPTCIGKSAIRQIALGARCPVVLVKQQSGGQDGSSLEKKGRYE